MNKKSNIPESNKRGLCELASLSFKELIRLKEDEEQQAFNDLIKNILPDVEGYIARSLSASVRNGYITNGRYKVEEFVNELYVLAYENIGMLEDEKDLPFWLFQKADELLQNTLVKEDHNKRFLDNLEHYTKAEWMQMQEDFRADGEGELMLMEEFDDPPYPKYEYGLNDALVVNPEHQWLEQVSIDLGKPKAHQHIDMVLHRLPAPMKSIYDLAVNQKFSPHEISMIKGIPIERVQSYLEETRLVIRSSFESRYGKKGVSF